jgi:(S)-ureidoglycine aminohydrolase
MNALKTFPSPSDYVAGNRAAIVPGEYVVLPPENRCLSAHPNLRDADEQVFVTPKLGASYVMSEVVIRPGGGTVQPFNNRLEHFLFMIEGKLELTAEGSAKQLQSGSFAWIPPHQPYEYINRSEATCRLVWFRRRYQPLEGVDIPRPVFGDESDIAAVPEVDLNPEKQLIPYTNPGIDMAFNLIVCPPGAYYGLVETHAWEHAMYMLNGEGILFLNGKPLHVKEKDFVYIAPYCPEWFCALGMDAKPVRFLLYWDCNRAYEDALDD